MLGADGFEQSSHIVIVSEHERVLLRVVGVHVSLTHLVQLIRVVTFAVFLDVLGLRTKQI